jgi:hypothetical protein
VTDLEREFRSAIDNAHRAAARCEEVCDFLMGAVPAGELAAHKAQLLEDRLLIDQLIAWAHGANRLPNMTPGAQAVKCKAGDSHDPF